MTRNIYDPNNALAHIIKAFEEIEVIRSGEIDHVHGKKEESASIDRTSSRIAENAR